MEDSIKELLSIFDWQYILSVNIVTYVTIKTLDELNGDKVVSYYIKLLVSIVCGLLVGFTLVKLEAITLADCIYNFILSLVSWDYIIKPVLRLISNKLDYKQRSEYDK